MKRKFNYLGSAVPALALSLALLGGIAPPDSVAEGSASFPLQPGIEDENPNPENNEKKEEEIQPLSDRDEKEKIIYE